MNLSLWVICIHYKNNFWGEEEELCTGTNPGGQACQEDWTQAAMVNTVKLLLISQQSGPEVVEQEGLRIPFHMDGSST